MNSVFEIQAIDQEMKMIRKLILKQRIISILGIAGWIVAIIIFIFK